ncbi:MAG: hypothetical protein EOO16_15045 [Chitinophagaceae bacterium]|nr:MAG: hypothetical protein EOO16_15045 [Chitinophagaceae bacterium]
MRFEEHDKDLAGRLGDLLPAGSHFREEAVWAGLNDALGRRRRIVYLRRVAVAAVLLLALGAVWLLRDAGNGALPPQVARPARAITNNDAARGGMAARRETPAPVLAAKTTVAIRAGKGQTVVTPRLIQHPSADSAPEAAPQLATAPPKQEAPATATVALASSAPPPVRNRFRVGHINDETLSQPVAIEQPVEESNNYGLLRHRATAGPSVELAEPAPRQRTLMSLFKSHQ